VEERLSTIFQIGGDMAFENVTSENVFEGAIVYRQKIDDKFYVYKVNKKSMYVGQEDYKTIMNRWENRQKGFTWKSFMERHGGQMTKFDTWVISKEEVSRKEAFEKINQTRKMQKPPMSKQGEKQVALLYKTYQKGKGNYKFVNEIGNDRIIVVLFTDDEWSFLNINGSRFLYDLRENIYIPYKKEVHKPEGSEILWPKREYEKSENEEKQAV